MEFPKTTDALQRLFNAYQNKAGKHVEKVLRREMLTWKKRFPKREVRFLDAIGYAAIYVDGRSVEDEYTRCDRLERIYTPLVELVRWYRNMQDRFYIYADEIKM